MKRRPLLLPTALVGLIAAGGLAVGVRQQACAAPTAGTLAPATPGSLRAAAARGGISVGTALSWHALTTDARYFPALLRDFDAVTLENASKWGTVQHTEGAWDWSRADEAVGEASAAGLSVRAHPLVWDEHVPGWAVALPPDAFRAASDDFIEQAVSRYAGQVDTWDVINELIEDDGRQSTAPLFSGRGAGQAEAAFRLARAEDPSARLFYNDDAIAWNNERSQGVEAMLRRWKAEGVPIDGVGMEMHLRAGRAPPEQTVRQRIRAFGDLGLHVEITELDVRTAHLSGAPRGRQIAQARAFYDAVHACVAEPACGRVSFWGFTDRHSPWPQGEAATLLDEDYTPKLAWRAVKAALEDRPPPFCADELVPNGTFEQGIGGWTANGARLTLDTADASAGRAALRVVDREADWASPQLDLTDILSEGVAWELRTQVRADGSAPAPLKWTLRADMASGAPHYTVLWEGEGQPGVWAEAQATVSLELPGTPTKLTLYLEGPPAGVDVAVDSVSLKPACR